MVEKAGLPPEHLGAQGAKTSLGIHRGDCRDDPVQVRANAIPVGGRFSGNNAEPRGLPHLPHRPRRRKQRLARDAPRVEAIAAHEAPLDQRHRGSKLRGPGSNGQAGSAGPDDDDVKIRHGYPGGGGTALAAATAMPTRPVAAEYAAENSTDKSGVLPSARIAPTPAPIELRMKLAGAMPIKVAGTNTANRISATAAARLTIQNGNSGTNRSASR